MTNIATSGKRWFARGMAGGFLVLAALNALSWFWLSEGWSDLWGGTRNANSEAIGFPMEIWREGEFYGNGWMVDFPMLAVNLLFALLLAISGGLLARRIAPKLNELVHQSESGSRSSESKKITFSVRGLLLLTTVVAVAFGLTGTFGVSPWLLGEIYFLGPLVLVMIAMGPAGIHWEKRVFILIVCAAVMLVGAVMTGTSLGMEFDRVLFGVFVCWVPQSVFASIAVIAKLMVSQQMTWAGHAKR